MAIDKMKILYKQKRMLLISFSDIFEIF